MSIIYRKTTKGVTEIETRANKLSPRLRTLLIMIDGKRDTAGLQGFAQQATEEILAALTLGGFIEPAGESVQRRTPVPAPAAPATARRTEVVPFDVRRRTVVRALIDLVGPAAETLAIKLERAGNEDELAALAPHALRIILAMRGRAAAEEFAARQGFTIE